MIAKSPSLKLGEHNLPQTHWKSYLYSLPATTLGSKYT
jgi:hypothetical protein